MLTVILCAPVQQWIALPLSSHPHQGRRGNSATGGLSGSRATQASRRLAQMSRIARNVTQRRCVRERERGTWSRASRKVQLISWSRGSSTLEYVPRVVLQLVAPPTTGRSQRPSDHNNDDMVGPLTQRPASPMVWWLGVSGLPSVGKLPGTGGQTQRWCIHGVCDSVSRSLVE